MIMVGGRKESDVKEIRVVNVGRCGHENTTELRASFQREPVFSGCQCVGASVSEGEFSVGVSFRWESVLSFEGRRFGCAAEKKVSSARRYVFVRETFAVLSCKIILLKYLRYIHHLCTVLIDCLALITVESKIFAFDSCRDTPTLPVFSGCESLVRNKCGVMHQLACAVESLALLLYSTRNRTPAPAHRLSSVGTVFRRTGH
jgi:hypothetical protein